MSPESWVWPRSGGHSDGQHSVTGTGAAPLPSAQRARAGPCRWCSEVVLTPRAVAGSRRGGAGPAAAPPPSRSTSFCSRSRASRDPSAAGQRPPEGKSVRDSGGVGGRRHPGLEGRMRGASPWARFCLLSRVMRVPAPYLGCGGPLLAACAVRQAWGAGHTAVAAWRWWAGVAAEQVGARRAGQETLRAWGRLQARTQKDGGANLQAERRERGSVLECSLTCACACPSPGPITVS